MRAFLGESFNPSRKAAPSWEEWNDLKVETARGSKQREFRKALGGFEHRLGRDELYDMLLKYQVLGKGDLDIEVKAIAKKWIESHDGHFEALKLALREKTPDPSRARREVELRKRRELKEGEARDGAVTLAIWQDYANRKRNGFEGIVGLSAWLAKTRENRAKRDRSVKAWRQEKEREWRREARDAKKAAPAELATAEVRSLYDACHRSVPLAVDVVANRPSRTGLDVNRAIRDAVKAAAPHGGVLTKRAFDEVFASLAFSLMADKRVAARALAIADTSTRVHAEAAARRRDEELDLDAAPAVFDASPDEARARAEKLREGKQAQSAEEYGVWLKDKNRAARVARRSQLSEKGKKADDLASAGADVKAALADVLAKRPAARRRPCGLTLLRAAAAPPRREPRPG